MLPSTPALLLQLIENLLGIKGALLDMGERVARQAAADELGPLGGGGGSGGYSGSEGSEVA